MNKAKYESQVARVLVNSKVKAVIVEWITPPTSHEFRVVLNKALEVLKENKLTRWIGDVRHLGAVGEEDQQWSNTVWFPLALDSGISKMGIIVSDDIFNQLSVEEIMSKVDSDGLSTHYFSSPDEALSWIA